MVDFSSPSKLSVADCVQRVVWPAPKEDKVFDPKSKLESTKLLVMSVVKLVVKLVLLVKLVKLLAANGAP